jgi:rhodanese-related sulfurtransferase
MQPITRTELKHKLDEGQDLALVEVLKPPAFAKFHLPGAINVPVDADDFEEQVEAAVPDKNKPIVVYCQNADCQASPKAARRLDELGYETVLDYEAGKVDWRDAGLPIES